MEQRMLVFFSYLFQLSQKKFITRPNCALDRRTILCVYVPRFHRQTFKHVPKFQWIQLTKIPWIPRTNICNVNFVGTFVVPLIPQQANIASCSGFRNCERIPKSVSGIRKCKWNRQNLYVESANVRGFRKLEVDSEFCLLLTLHMNSQN